jgi:3-dehydroquinate synthase
VRRGLIGADVALRQERLLRALGLPTAPLDWPADALLAAMHSDKKAVAGQLRFVLPTRLGAAELVEGIPEDDVRAALTALASG